MNNLLIKIFILAAFFAIVFFNCKNTTVNKANNKVDTQETIKYRMDFEFDKELCRQKALDFIINLYKEESLNGYDLDNPLYAAISVDEKYLNGNVVVVIFQNKERLNSYTYFIMGGDMGIEEITNAGFTVKNYNEIIKGARDALDSYQNPRKM
jgi:hypothetical protein